MQLKSDIKKLIENFQGTAVKAIQREVFLRQKIICAHASRFTILFYDQQQHENFEFSLPEAIKQK